MKTAKSEGGLSRGRMRNSDYVHKCWVLTLNHFSDVNHLMEVAVNKHSPLHEDIGETLMKRDAEMSELAVTRCEENNPFDDNRDKNLLVSFSTGFTSTADDAVNAEIEIKFEREMQTKLDGKSVTSTVEVRFKVKTLSSIRKTPKVNEKNIYINSLKMFIRLIILAQRNNVSRYKFRVRADSLPLVLAQKQRLKIDKGEKGS